jgi:uncharacterized protein with FMN-binding domain
MATQKSSRASGTSRIVRQSLVSGFVVASYLAYAIHNQFGGSTQGVALLPSAVSSSQVAQGQSQNQSTAALAGQPASLSTSTVAQGQYKDGTFTGPTTNAYYGQVQVQVVINGGKISAVTFLNYPQDRRTSQRINAYAVPQLQTEAVQAQTAKVNVVSGATLTSQAFMASLQSALNSAKG